MVVHFSLHFTETTTRFFCFLRWAPGEIVGSDADSNSGQNCGGSIAMCVGRAKHIIGEKWFPRWELNFLVLKGHGESLSNYQISQTKVVLYHV